MNTPSLATVRQLHALVSAPNPSPAASSAWRLLLTMHGPHATLDEMDNGRAVRIPLRSVFERVKKESRMRPGSDLTELMGRCIRFNLSGGNRGKGNRARRRAALLGMQAHNRAWTFLAFA